MEVRTHLYKLYGRVECKGTTTTKNSRLYGSGFLHFWYLKLLVIMVLKNPLNYDNFHCPILNGNTCSHSKPCLLLKYFTFTVILGTLPIDQKAFTRISAIIQTCSFKNGHHITHIPLEDTPDVSPTVYEGSLWWFWGSLGYLPRGPVGKIIERSNLQCMTSVSTYWCSTWWIG